ncbi:MAG: PAS domain S-box protein, partial [Lutibacter sp.]|nr:PAS domain S-box protein [Lutibacter sp.]
IIIKMKISLKTKILLGYIFNFVVILALGLIYWNHILPDMPLLWDWISLGLIVLSLGLLTVVYFIIQAQLKAKNEAEMESLENRKLLQSIIDNTTNPISVKKINGEYLLINKQYENLYNLKEENIKGKTDHDFLPKETADKYRSTDLEAVKLGKEIQVEEVLEQPDGLHTYLAVKFPLFDAANRVFAVGTIATDITERIKSQELLVAGNTFFNLSRDLLIISSNDTFLKVNPATTRILGYTEQELLGKPFMSFVYAKDIELTLQEVNNLKSGALTANFENRFVCKDGTIKWLNWTTYPDVETGLLYAVARDVTFKKEVEESLKAADTFFEMSLDILVVASKNMFVKINPSLSKILGYSTLELKSKPFTSFVFSEDIAETEKAIEELQKGTPMVNFKNRWVCKDGDIKWLSWTATTDPETEVLYAIARDITDQLKLEEEEQAALEELYENQQRLNLILENISDGVIVANTNKKVVLANHIANELFGTEDDTKIPPNFSEHFELYFPDEKTIFPIQNLPLERALVGEATDDVDVVLWDPKSEKKKRVLLSGRPIIDQEKEVVAAVITIKDITRYKKLQEELKKTEQKYRSLIGFRKNDNKKDNNNKEGGETQIEKGKETKKKKGTEMENEPDNIPK